MESMENTYTEPITELSPNPSADNSPVPALLIDSRNLFNQIGADVSETYSELGSFIAETSKDISEFIRMIEPYIGYYYASSNEPGTFVGDVILPGRDDMIIAVNYAVSVMQHDEQIYNKIAQSIEYALTLRDKMDGIISVIEDIEIYFQNTMIIAIKAGSEGHALTTISREMGVLSRAICDISDNFKSLIGQLDEENETFKTIRGNIAAEQENYLTQMSLSISVFFRDMLKHFGMLSEDIGSIMGNAYTVEQIMGSIILRVQMEDLIRQNIEKAVYLVDYYDSSTAPGAHIHTNDRLVGMMVSDKFRSVNDGMLSLSKDFNELTDKTRFLSSEIITKVSGVRSDGNDGNADIMDHFYERIEQMRDEFINRIEIIICEKHRIQQLLIGISEMTSKFTDFFNAINHIIHRFDVINMLTRIEVARNNTLDQLLSGTLSDITELPQRIKQSVHDAQALHEKVSATISGEIAEYNKTIADQKTRLSTSIDQIKKVSIKLHESKKYYGDIRDKVAQSSSKIISFIDSRTEAVEKLGSINTMISQITDRLNEYANVGSEYSSCEEVEAELEKLLAVIISETDDDYKTRMLRSLFGEYCCKQTEDKTVLF